MRSASPKTLGLLACCLGLVWWLVREPAEPPPIRTAGAATEAAALPPLPPPSPPVAGSEDVAAVVSRPLFTPDRQPQSRPRIPAEPAGPLSLAGIAGPPSDRIALLGTPDASLHRVRAGATVAGWTLDQIGADWVRLIRGSEELHLVLTWVPALPPQTTESPAKKRTTP